MERNVDVAGRVAALAGLVCLVGCGVAGRDPSAAPDVAARAGAPVGATLEAVPRTAPYTGPVTFSVVAEGLTASFTDHSRGQISRQDWDFGDGATSAAATPIHAFSRVGVYDVTETIVDESGKSFTRKLPVRVMPFPPELRNGEARPALSAVATYELHYFVRPPLGATQLAMNLSGPDGQADLYLKFGSVPTDDSFDCHAPIEGGVARCTVDAPRAGPYYARILARKTFAGASLVASWK